MNNIANMKRIIFLQGFLFAAVLSFAYISIFKKRNDFPRFLDSYLQSRLDEIISKKKSQRLE